MVKRETLAGEAVDISEFVVPNVDKVIDREWHVMRQHARAFQTLLRGLTIPQNQTLQPQELPRGHPNRSS